MGGDGGVSAQADWGARVLARHNWREPPGVVSGPPPRPFGLFSGVSPGSAPQRFGGLVRAWAPRDSVRSMLARPRGARHLPAVGVRGGCSGPASSDSGGGHIRSSTHRLGARPASRVVVIVIPVLVTNGCLVLVRPHRVGAHLPLSPPHPQPRLWIGSVAARSVRARSRRPHLPLIILRPSPLPWRLLHCSSRPPG